MLGQRRRRWASIGPALGQSLVFAGSVVKPNFVSHINVVPKRNNKLRLIQNPVRVVKDRCCKVTLWCEDIEIVAQLIEPKDDLVTVDIKNGFTTSKYMVSTVHRSHLITIITKAFNTTSISYQPLWLCCLSGYISSFLFTKNCDPSS